MIMMGHDMGGGGGSWHRAWFDVVEFTSSIFESMLVHSKLSVGLQ